ncbi:MAG: hypothetical protein V3S01_03290, partial [Dehalococcoidia bacterium]
LTLRWDTDFTTTYYDFVTTWWDGSIAVPKTVELGPFTTGGQVCLTLSRTDVVTLYTSSPNPQCPTFSPISTTHTYRWEGLTAGTYTVSETLSGPYEVMSPITGIVVDDAHQDVHLPTVENQLSPGGLLIEKRDADGNAWISPTVTFEIYACGADLDCASLEGLVTTAIVSATANPASVALDEGRYLVREIVPAGFIARPDDEQPVDIHAAVLTTTLVFTNRPPEGCSPGFWKNNTDLWDDLTNPGDFFNATFEVLGDGTSPFTDTMTLEQAINLEGGGFDKLARHGVAALLNARSGIYYTFFEGEVIGMVQSGLIDDGTPGEPEATALSDANSLDCPLE